MAGILKGIRAAFGDVEMTPYTVISEKDGYEERVYPARKWACTTMKGTSQPALVSPMFRVLFNYISGKNEPNIRIDMTSPVTTYVEPGAGPTCESTFTMAFLVPEEHQENPPVPSDKSIFIEDRPELCVLTRRYGGYTTDEVLTKEGKELGELIRKNNEPEVNFDQYYIVGYDPPFKLFSRRNEIWFVKAKSDKKENEGVEGEKKENEGVEGEKKENEVLEEKKENGVVKEAEHVNDEGAEKAKEENAGTEEVSQENMSEKVESEKDVKKDDEVKEKETED